MNYNEDYNPFADSSIKQATASSFANQQANNEYNPFTNRTTAAQPAAPPQYPYVAPSPPQQPNVAAVLPPAQPAPFYASPTPPPPTSQSADKYSVDAKQATTRIDLSAHERQQDELAEREKRLADRERVLTEGATLQKREKNFPPLPKCCPIGPCFFQDISIEIPGEFQIWVRYLYFVWIAYSVTLFLNFIAGLSYFVVDKEGGTTFGLSLVYFVLFIPLSYICWFRPIYRAFRQDSASNFMIFFFVFFIQIIITTLQCLGISNLGCGFILMIKLFAAGGSKILVGLICMIVTVCFALLAVADSLLMIQVHRLYRASGASLEQAQREFQTAFVNNPTVRGAAREVATAGINEALRPDANQQRPIY